MIQGNITSTGISRSCYSSNTARKNLYENQKTKNHIKNRKETNHINFLNETDKYAIDLASEKGASNWLNALPLSRYNFNLNKLEFRVGIYLRYGWEPTKTPLTCACGADFNLTQALH